GRRAAVLVRGGGGGPGGLRGAGVPAARPAAHPEPRPQPGGCALRGHGAAGRRRPPRPAAHPGPPVAGRRADRRARRLLSDLASGVRTKGGTDMRLGGHDLTLGYDGRVVAQDLTVEIPDNSFTVIVG